MTQIGVKDGLLQPNGRYKPLLQPTQERREPQKYNWVLHEQKNKDYILIKLVLNLLYRATCHILCIKLVPVHRHSRLNASQKLPNISKRTTSGCCVARIKSPFLRRRRRPVYALTFMCVRRRVCAVQLAASQTGGQAALPFQRVVASQMFAPPPRCLPYSSR